MVRGVVVLVAAVMSLLAESVPAGTALSMGVAALVGIGASRLHAQAERLTAGGDPDAAETVRLARLCDDAAVALCVLALLFTIPL